MKYLFLSIFVLCLGLVGCNKGPNTGWECPECGWGCAKNAIECISESCTGYACPSCGDEQFSVKSFLDFYHDGSPTRRIWHRQKCGECGFNKTILLTNEITDYGVLGTTSYSWKRPNELDGYIEPFKPVKR